MLGLWGFQRANIYNYVRRRDSSVGIEWANSAEPRPENRDKIPKRGARSAQICHLISTFNKCPLKGLELKSLFFIARKLAQKARKISDLGLM